MNKNEKFKAQKYREKVAKEYKEKIQSIENDNKVLMEKIQSLEADSKELQRRYNELEKDNEVLQGLVETLIECTNMTPEQLENVKKNADATAIASEAISKAMGIFSPIFKTMNGV